jgi:tetratricopeptide (TPR) repeat protein
MVLLIPAFGQMNPEEWFAKGVALMNQSNYHEAIKAFDKAVELNPQYTEAWAGKGWAFYGSSRYNEALQEYNKAIELDPNYADAWVGKGFALLALDLLSETLNAFNQAIALDPNHGLAWIGKLFVYSPHQFNTFFNADIFDKAIKLNPNYAARLVASSYYGNLSFQREVFLKGGCPRTSEATRFWPS